MVFGLVSAIFGFCLLSVGLDPQLWIHIFVAARVCVTLPLLLLPPPLLRLPIFAHFSQQQLICLRNVFCESAAAAAAAKKKTLVKTNCFGGFDFLSLPQKSFYPLELFLEKKCLETEATANKMDWMYKGISGIADREEYLTGRKIDKTFEMMERASNPNAAKDEEESAPINQLTSGSGTLAEATTVSVNDLTAKMREDPLFAIQMKQHEQRKEILQNPVKLKAIQELLKTALKEDKKHKSKKKKKDKKSKKKHKQKDKESRSGKSSHSKKSRKRASSDSSSDSSESESSSDESEDEKEERRKRKRIAERRSRSPDRRHRGDSRSDRRRYDDEPARKTSTHSKESHVFHSHSSSSSSYDHRRHQSESSSSRNREHSSHSSSAAPDKRPPAKKPYERPPAAAADLRSKKPTRPRLTEEEIRKRREEMMSNAEWREQERAETVKKLTAREEEEDRRQMERQQNGGKSASFIKPLLSDIAGSSSIEDSIRQKKFTSQRGPGLMDRNFARR